MPAVAREGQNAFQDNPESVAGQIYDSLFGRSNNERINTFVNSLETLDNLYVKTYCMYMQEDIHEKDYMF